MQEIIGLGEDGILKIYRKVDLLLYGGTYKRICHTECGFLRSGGRIQKYKNSHVERSLLKALESFVHKER